ncbi:ABC transporter ATP-binding protein [Pseudothermotoga sp. U03pept]|uniref:ABC transporter ATP-binding protein n=1 Tax=Pseudothermotoga sp. U03pept TaxID=3447012 RepID=UPI003F0307A2
MPWIEFVNVVKHFDNVIAVKNVSFSIERNDFFTLLGPSGCGKTTTLRLIAGLEIPDDGKIFIANQDVTYKLPKERNVAMVFQNYALYPHMTVKENISYPLVVRKMPKAEIEKRVGYIAQSLQIHQLLDRYPQQISGGQQQRVALARAMIQTPSVFLLDEPLSNLDAKLRLEARSFLKHLYTELGTAVVYVTHDQAEAMALSTKIAVMDNGVVKQIGSPKEIYDEPANTFVASFIGNPPMNILRCEISENHCYIGEQRIDLQPSLKKDLQRGYLGIRPENLQLHPTKGDLVAEIFVVEPLGVETIVTLSVNGYQLKSLVFEDVPYKPGDKIWINFKRDKIHIFDENGQRVAR